jgi:hypothetical protein
MAGRFREKLNTTHRRLRHLININICDMTKFSFDSKFEIIMIPWRALQWLPEREKTIECLERVRGHLSPNGIFIFDIFKPRIYDEKWLGKEDFSYDITDGGRRIIRSTVNHYADTEKKYIQYINRIKILEDGVETVREDMLTIKYYEYGEIVKLLKSLRFTILEEYGYYDRRAIKDGDEMIFVCGIR